MNPIKLFALFIILSFLVFSYNSEDLLRESLAPYGVDVKEIGITNEGAFLKYEQKATTSPMDVHASAIIAMTALADQFPETENVFAITLVGGKPVMVTTARTSDVLAYAKEEISPSDFSKKMYSKPLVEESRGSSACCFSALILLALPVFIIIYKCFSSKDSC